MRHRISKGKSKRAGMQRLTGLILAAAVFLVMACSPAMAEEESLEPLDSTWKNIIAPKHRAIVSFENADWGITTFRGQDEELQGSDLDAFYGKDALVTTIKDLGISGKNSNCVFSMAQAAGTVLQTAKLKEGNEFMGKNTFEDVPTGVLCSSYFILLNDDRDTQRTAFWIELTGNVEATDRVERIGRVKLTDIPRPYKDYKFKADARTVYAPSLDSSRPHDMVAWDWNEDGHTDWLISYLSNDSSGQDKDNMRVIFLLVDGRSLYEAAKGEGTVKFWYNKELKYVTGDSVFFGTTSRKPPNSVRTAIGDMNGDGKPEVALYFTKVQGAHKDKIANQLSVLELTYDGIKDPTWEWISSDGVGSWNLQSDSVAVAVGDLDGDGKAEIATLHSNGKFDPETNKMNLYLDVYKFEGEDINKIINGKKVGEVSEMPKEKYATPGLEAAIADLNGDGFGELVWVETYAEAAHKLDIVVAKWPSGLGGEMRQYNYELVNLVNDWTLDVNFPRFSMNVGYFIYPEKEVIRNQIGLVTTAPGSLDGRMGLRWGIFEWDMTSGMKVLGSGNRDNGTRVTNVVPSLVAADLDRGSMILGEPTGFTVRDNIEPIFITQAPPRHLDVLDIDGEEKTMDAFSHLRGYSTTMMGKTSDSHGESTTSSSSGSWGATSGFSLMKNNRLKPNTTIFNMGLKYAGQTAAKNTSGKTRTTSFSLTFTAEHDDQIYYRANTHDVWRYPVLAPQSQAEVFDDDGESHQRFIQFIVPRVITSSFSPTQGKRVDWYEPRHNGLNLFSYPKKLEQTRDFPLGRETKDPQDLWKDINGVVLARSSGQIVGNPDPSQATFTIEGKEHADTLSSLKHTMSAYANLNLPARGLLLLGVGNFSLNGDGTWGTDSTTTTDASKLGGATLTWPGLASYASPSGMPSDELGFTTDAAIYTSDGGALSVAYAVTNLKRPYSGIWGADSPYSKTADPALNLPYQWTFDNNKWQRNKHDGVARRVRGVLFEGASIVASPGGVSGQVMPMNTPVSATFRVFNYSFVATGEVTVTLAFQPIGSLGEEPDSSKANVLTTETIDSIPGRDSGTKDNWQDIKIPFTTPNRQAGGYLHISLSTDGGNLSTDNDSGHILVGIYDPAKQNVAGKAMGATDGSAVSEKSLTITPDTLSVRPLEEDGTPGEEATYLEAGRTALVRANIRYDNPDAAGEDVLLFVNVYLRDGDGITGHRTIPLLKNGEENRVQMLFTSRTDDSIPLQMIVTSDTLPALQDANPEGRMAQIVLNGDDDSGGGCALGATWTPAALLLALPLLLLRRR